MALPIDGKEGDLSQARILLTNDDGIHAPGLAALERVARRITEDVWVVAPETEQSATSHSLTLRRPLRAQPFGHRRFAVDGTPTDCVLLGVLNLIEGRRPDLVLSGINRGGNLGEDVHYSGTVAGAKEAAQLGLPAIALSQVRRRDEVMSYDTAEAHAADVIRRLAELDWIPGTLINVNFPHRAPDRVTGIRACRQGRRKSEIKLVEGHDPFGRPYFWIGDFTRDDDPSEDTDLAAIRAGAIAVSPLHMDMTDRGRMETLEKLLAEDGA